MNDGKHKKVTGGAIVKKVLVKGQVKGPMKKLNGTWKC